MAQYNYRSILYTDTSNVAGLNITQNNNDLADYVNNYQASDVKASSITIAETTFNIDLSYTAFKALIATPFSWSDVKEIVLPGRYELHLLSSSPI